MLSPALTFPTNAELAEQPTHYAKHGRILAEACGEEGFTPDGNYWVRRRDKTAPEIAACTEEEWYSLSMFIGEEWSSSNGEPTPEVLYGPMSLRPGAERRDS